MSTVEIAGIPIGDDHPCCVVAEIGVNHQGDILKALHLIGLAKEAGCDFVKLQKRTPEISVPEAEWNELRDTPWGKMTKIAYRRRVEFGLDEYRDIDRACQRRGIPWFVSVWDVESVEWLVASGLPIHALKIPSARLHDDALLKSAVLTGKPIILSTGMSTTEDVKHAVFVLRSQHRVGSPELILLACTSAYPARADESNLRVIQTFKREFGCPVGFSSHKIGQLTVLLAVAAGANMIERHLTADRRMKGSDHRLSTEPAELARLVREVRQVEAIMGSSKKIILPSELAEAKRLGRALP